MDRAKRFDGPWTGSIRPTSNRGAVIILVALALVVLMAFASLAVDSAFFLTVHSDLRRTADAAALASASGLVVGQAEARQRASRFAQLNEVLETPVSLADQQIEFGAWDAANDLLLPSSAPNASRVRIRLGENTTPAGPRSFFGTLAGTGRTEVIAASSTAALGTRSIVLTLDRSGSMADDGANPEQPLTDTKLAAQNFLTRLRNFPINGDRVGLVFYNDVAQIQQPLTDNFSLVTTAIGNATSGPSASGWTNIAAALCRARSEINSPRAGNRGARVVILLSDGKTNTRVNPSTCTTAGPAGIDNGQPPGNLAEQQALSQARALGGDGVVVYTISLGNATNRPLMTQMAQETGGRHYMAPTSDDLDEVFEQIAAQIPIALVE